MTYSRTTRPPLGATHAPEPPIVEKQTRKTSPVLGKKKISRTRQPDDMTLDEWQIALRREYGREQNFLLENVGADPFFSEFFVTNPETGKRYRVAIRGTEPAANYCSCPDYAVNALGTCKHIEFALQELRKTRGARAAFRRGYHPPYSEIFLRYGAARRVEFRPGRECPPAVRQAAARCFDAGGVLQDAAFDGVDEFLKTAQPFAHEIRFYDDALAFVAEARDRNRRAARIDKMFPDGENSAAFSGLVKTALFPYQRKGALFAAKAGRCLIADEMGLGKTVQAIAAVEILARTAGLERVLIVCPTSLKHQWRDEIERFTDRAAEIVEGALPVRAQKYRTESFYKIANYDVIARDAEAIRQWGPELIVLDEAQRIKNWRTRTAKSVKNLRSPFAIVLTGTPLENRLEELHSIVEFVDIFRLGPLFRFLGEHQRVDDYGRVIGYRQLGAINKTLAPLLVRRTKSEVLLDLPARLDKKFFVPMTPEQMQHHEDNAETVGRIVAKWRRYHFLSDTDQRRLMIALQNMRMSCDGTYLLDQTTDYGRKADELMTLLGEMFERPDTKAVVFSQWLRMHELIAARLAERKWDYVLFHGGVPGPQRKDLVRKFKNDPGCRLFLATDAGGVGLNLQNASVVVIMDQPWNPAVLEQRIGRVHRLGQQQPVNVVHFIAQGTIEHGMLSLLSFKKALFAGALDGGQEDVFLGGTKLTRFMESVEQATGSIPAPMPTQDGGAGEPEAEKETDAPDAGEKTARPAAPGAAAPPLEELIQSGMSFLQKLGQVLTAKAGEGEKATPIAALNSFVQTDAATGQTYVKLPMPSADTLTRLAELIGSFAEGAKKPRA
jgi:superfamily II DNA or RNA helicase